LKLGFANGCFDGLHAGHRFFLEKAKDQCTYLVIAINTDESVKAIKGSTRPVVPLESRIRELHHLGVAHAILPFDGDPVPLIEALKPDVLIRGERQSSQGAELVPILVRLPNLHGFRCAEDSHAPQ
jgi:D-beta-D-heptose 7-phosphate kinase / D-beta-D-heptose 1-phosphate adenosyltransferase